MANDTRISWQEKFETAQNLKADNEDGNFPIENAQNTDVNIKYKSTTGQAGSTVTISWEYSTAKSHTYIALFGLDFLDDDPSATITFKLNSVDSGWASPDFETTLTNYQSAIEAYNIAVAYFTEQTYQYAQLELDGDSGVDQYDIGRIKLGSYVSFPNSPNIHRASIGYDNLSTLIPLRSGGMRSEKKRPRPKIITASWGWIRSGDDTEDWLYFRERAGHDLDIFISVFPEDSDSDKERRFMMLGRIIGNPMFDIHSTVIESGSAVEYGRVQIRVRESI